MAARAPAILAEARPRKTSARRLRQRFDNEVHPRRRTGKSLVRNGLVSEFRSDHAGDQVEGSGGLRRFPPDRSNSRPSCVEAPPSCRRPSMSCGPGCGFADGVWRLDRLVARGGGHDAFPGHMPACRAKLGAHPGGAASLASQTPGRVGRLSYRVVGSKSAVAWGAAGQGKAHQAALG